MSAVCPAGHQRSRFAFGRAPPGKAVLLTKAGVPLLLLAALVFPGGTSLASGGGGQISGMVADTASQPLAGICVGAASSAGGNAFTSTDASGHYALSNLTPTTSLA